jgi:hypothetical protein
VQCCEYDRDKMRDEGKGEVLLEEKGRWLGKVI